MKRKLQKSTARFPVLSARWEWEEEIEYWKSQANRIEDIARDYGAAGAVVTVRFTIDSPCGRKRLGFCKVQKEKYESSHLSRLAADQEALLRAALSVARHVQRLRSRGLPTRDVERTFGKLGRAKVTGYDISEETPAMMLTQMGAAAIYEDSERYLVGRIDLDRPIDIVQGDYLEELVLERLDEMTLRIDGLVVTSTPPTKTSPFTFWFRAADLVLSQ